MENEVKTIKGVDTETWTDFKTLAAKKRVTMGKLLALMIMEYKKNSDDFWDSILKGEKILSDKEAEDMHKITRKLRKEWGFRHVPDF